ncbi:MAG: LruC domain-containing protein [Candidatus Cyclonatronum sp.]|uniref:LruC domain-containing protein n=1 Tax=Cyclonatronum sp. TaxID=3024185 RepID=UPI0025BFE3DD|nr:LruC domain-containing protein [Cyclonatronum sp.]MCC5935380.1 LruC domain-containing protein [Balneolales bacterium]MCH8487739.1 LruC domain-containing protein [Cyclonatronum sp.]
MKTNLTKTALIVFIIAGLSACNINQSSSDRNSEEPTLPNLKVSENFTWSNNLFIDLEIQFPDQSLAGTMMEVRYPDGALLSRLNITEQGISYTEILPDFIEELVLFHPASGSSKTIKAESAEINFDIAASRSASDMPDFALLNNDDDAGLLSSFTISHRYHMFEDLWPGTGDFDFNDFVFFSQETFFRNANNRIERVEVEVTYLARGANLTYGLGVQVLRGSDNNRVYLPDNSILFDGDATDDPAASNTAIISANLNQNSSQWTTFQPRFNTNPTVWSFGFDWDTSLAANQLPQLHFFLFSATNRGREIHSVGHPPTEAASNEWFGTREDNSTTTPWVVQAGNSFSLPLPFYRDENNLPWGMSLLVTPLIQPMVIQEKVMISDAYPFFIGWAQSAGTTNQSWWLFPNTNLVLTPPAP